MNYITIQNLNELQFIIDADIYISGSAYGQQEEIYNNTWQISFDRALSLKLKKINLEKFFYELIEKRSLQIDEISKNLPVTFYMWVDEMSMQLCFNFISGQNPILPFGCKLNLIDDQNIIFDHLLATIAQGGLVSYDDIVFYEKDDLQLDEIEDEDPSENYVLDLCLVVLNQDEAIKNNILQCIQAQTIIDRKFSYELMQIFLDNYCKNNFNQDLIELVQNSRVQDNNLSFVTSNIIKPRIWQIWQQTIFKIMIQENSKVLNLLVAFYATAYFLADYFDEFIDSADEEKVAFFKDIILNFAIDKNNKPINVSFWNDWIRAAEQLNTKYIELLHHRTSAK